MRAGARASGLFLAFWLLGGLLLAFTLLPLAGLVALQPLGRVLAAARQADTADAIAVSLEGAATATLFAALFGVPLAWALARAAAPVRTFLSALVDLPLAVPHTVAGIGLLLAFGRNGPVGAPAEALVGLRFWSTFAGVVAAMLFVSFPYTVNAARLGFEAVDPRLERVARTLGLGPWRVLLRVTLPLAARPILSGLILTFARAVSEFAAVAILAYYPMTAPVQIYELFLRFGLNEAAAAAVLLLGVSLALFLLLRLLAQGATRAAAEAAQGAAR